MLLHGATGGGGLRLRVNHQGRLIVATLAVTVTVAYGVLMYAFPVVLAAMQTELGWSQQLLVGAYSIGALVAGVAAVPIGSWIDRRGPRGVMTGCAILASLLVAAWSQVQSPLGLYAIWVGLGVCMAGLYYEPAFTTIAQWFRHRRARALTIVTVAGGLASTIFVPLTAELTARSDWRTAILVLACILAAFTILPHALVLRRGPRERDTADALPADAAAAGLAHVRAAATRTALRSTSLRWITVAFFLSVVVNTAFAVHLIPLLLERGHTLSKAGLALAAVGVMKLVGRLVFVPLATRFGTASATSAILLVQAFGLLVLIDGSAAAAPWISVVLVGAADGASTPARAEIVAERYGAAGYGTITGVIALFLAVARAAAPIAASALYAATGGYSAPLWLMAGLLVAAAGSLTAARAGRGPRAVA